jgi:hypothetical protein
MQRMTVQRSPQTLAPQRRADAGRARTASATTLIATPAVQSASFSVLQPKLMVGPANDPFEREADRTADEVMGAGSAPRIGGGGIAASLMRWVRRAIGKVEPIAKKDEPPVKKDEDDKKKLVQKDSIGAGPATVPTGIEASIDAMSAGGGSPLAPALREQFEPRFGYDFSDVRVHTGPAAAGAAQALGARAFTVGRDVFFGAGEYQPASAQGQRLVAHELTHTIQQAPAATRASRALSTTPAPVRAAPKRVQRLFDDIKAKIRNKVRDFITRDFPPWDLITLIIGWDPIQEKSVKGSTRDWIRAAMKLAPDGEALFARLDQEGKIDAVAKWWDAEIAKLDLSYASIVALANKAWESVGASDIFSPVAAWNEKIKPIFMPTITRVWEFIKAVGAKILAVVKDLVLGSLSAWAQTQRGYTLLTFALGKDPITGQEVKRTVKGLIFAVLDLVPGGEAIKENLEKSKTIEKASAWFSQEFKTLDLTWEGIKALFKQAWDAFKVSDLLNPKLLFEKMAAIFGPPLLRLLNFLIAVGKKVLEFIFEGAMMIAGPIGQQIAGIFRKIGQTFNTIVADPVAFVGHLVSAVKKGIQQFAKNILDHLKTGLIEWLVGTLDGAGLVLPKVWDLKGILDLVLQILGITYAKIRVKLVKVLGEKTVSMLETAFAFLKTLVTEGPAAAWKQIVEAIGSLWDMVIGGIKDWAITKIVTAAITKLVTMFNPAGAIIQAIIATYNTVAFFIERIKQILAFVEAVVDSIANIASGKIAQAANYVERAMGRTIPVILGFLARLIGLGNVSEAVKKVITAIQAKVDKGIDAVIKWVVDKAKSLFGSKTEDGKGDKTHDEKWKAGVAGVSADVSAIPEVERTEENLGKRLAGWKKTYGFSDLKVVRLDEGLEIDGSMSNGQTVATVGPQSATPPKYGALTNGYGTSVEVERMAKKPTGGGTPSVTSDGWKALTYRRNDSTGKSSYYVRGHLLNHNLGGPGSTWDNLTPLTQEGNNRSTDSMYYAFEKKVKTALLDDKREVTGFKVTIQYGAPSRSADIAAIDAELMKPSLSKAKAAEYRLVREVVLEEQRISTVAQCTATLGKGKKTTATEILNVTVNNSFQTVSWRDYKIKA